MKHTHKQVGIIFGIILIICLAFVLADFVLTPSTFSVNESINSLYNITFTNSETNWTDNVTQVNITLPSNLTFIANTNDTNATWETFINDTLNLSWTNTTIYLVNASDAAYFSFNATATYPGTYNLTLSFVNATGTFSSNMTITVNDTTNSVANFGTNPVNAINRSNTTVVFDLICTDNYNASVIELWTNSTGVWHANQTNASYINGSYWNVTVTGIAEGNYVWGVYCNDSAANDDWSTNRTFNVDQTAPNMTLISPNAAVSNATSHNFTFNVTESTTGVANCSIIVDGAIVNTSTSIDTSSVNSMYNGTFTVMTHNWSVNCTDFAGNRGNTSNFTFSVTPPTTSTSTSSSSSNTGTSTTLKVTEDQLAKGYTKVMYQNWKASFDLGEQSHTFEVLEVTESTSKIRVFSTPQEYTFSEGEEKKFNIDDDENYDLLIKLNDINEYYTQNRVNFTLLAIDEAPEKEQGVVEKVTETIGKISPLGTEENQITWTLGIAIAIIILIIFAFRYKIFNKKNKK